MATTKTSAQQKEKPEAKVKLKANPLAALTPQKQQTLESTNGLPLSEIRYVAPSTLTPNPLNSIFPVESDAYFDELTRDIKERGILDPLVAKQDGTLLTGHNRLTVALALKLPRVPVRYVQVEKISMSSGKTFREQEEIEFVIKDNLLRRHLSDDQRVKLYEKLYPNFHERRAKAILYGTLLSNGKKEGGDSVPPPPTDMLSIQEIATTTGQKAENVKKQMTRYYRKHPNVLEEATSSVQIAGKKTSVQTTAKTSPKPSSSREWKAFLKQTESLRLRLGEADEATRKQMLKELRVLIREMAR